MMSKKIFYLFVCLSFYSLFNGQKPIYIKDSITKENLKDVQVIVDNEIYYTNDDGAVVIPKSNSEIQISSSTYYRKNIKKLQDTIFLKPFYKEIEEVIIGKGVDITALINDVLFENKKNYYLDQSTFLINIKQKAVLDNKIHNILVGNLNLWTSNTMYNYALKSKNYNDFININVNDIKYIKSNKTSSEFNNIELKPSDFVYNLYMNVKLTNIKNEILEKKINVKTKKLFEDKDYQRIAFSYSLNNSDVDGTILYNKSDKVISTLEINVKNINYLDQKVNSFGKKYQTKTEQTSNVYEFCNLTQLRHTQK